jgi:spore coat polysaccharide biosynthesis predicted glycosyltransferase SpsG
VGTGHLARCYALAEIWTAHEDTAVLWTEVLPPPWGDRFESLGIEVVAQRPRTSFDWVVLDGYEFTAADHRATRAVAERILVVDDHCSLGTYDADLIVDQNLGAAASGYRVAEPLLAGPRYALLRSEFRAARPAQVRVEPVVRRIAPLAGGSPSLEVHSSVARAIESASLNAFEMVQFTDQYSFAATLATADIVLSAAGTTALEICCLGLPAVLFVAAENQRLVAEHLAAAGAAVDAGDGRDPAALAGAVVALAADRAARQQMAERAWALVDGEGAQRVVTRMRTTQIRLRPATIDDARLLLDWRTDEVTRRWSFSSADITWEGHVGWLRRTLDEVASLLLVAEDREGTPVGQLRFEIGPDGAAEVSVTMAPEARGGGLGAAVVAAGVDRLFESTATQTVIARIKPQNVASVATFVRADFDPAGSEQHRGSKVLLYSRRRHATRV